MHAGDLSRPPRHLGLLVEWNLSKRHPLPAPRPMHDQQLAPAHLFPSSSFHGPALPRGGATLADLLPFPIDGSRRPWQLLVLVLLPLAAFPSQQPLLPEPSGPGTRRLSEHSQHRGRLSPWGRFSTPQLA